MPREPIPPFEPDDSAGFRYMQFALFLEKRIRAGDYPPGARLPNARDLGAEHGIAEHTVRHAEMLMSDWGLIRVLAAKGCYVRPRKDWRRRGRGRKLGKYSQVAVTEGLHAPVSGRHPTAPVRSWRKWCGPPSRRCATAARTGLVSRFSLPRFTLALAALPAWPRRSPRYWRIRPG